jgi:hypothetical protein
MVVLFSVDVVVMDARVSYLKESKFTSSVILKLDLKSSSQAGMSFQVNSFFPLSLIVKELVHDRTLTSYSLETSHSIDA